MTSQGNLQSVFSFPTKWKVYLLGPDSGSAWGGAEDNLQQRTQPDLAYEQH